MTMCEAARFLSENTQWARSSVKKKKEICCPHFGNSATERRTLTRSRQYTWRLADFITSSPSSLDRFRAAVGAGETRVVSASSPTAHRTGRVAADALDRVFHSVEAIAARGVVLCDCAVESRVYGGKHSRPWDISVN